MNRLWVAACVLLSLGGQPRLIGSIDAPGVRRHCESGACNPRLGNLAAARELRTSTTCGINSTELFCSYSRRGCEDPPRCEKCSGTHGHPATAMTDSSFQFPHTWWQSALGSYRETIQLDLETYFYFTHLIMIFKSPRPAAMVLERSQDFGSTWKPYKYFATNCSDTFGLPDDQNGVGAICTSRYSNPLPCSRGEVIFRVLSPPHSVEDPYSIQAQELLKVTNIRVCLLKRQPCPCPAQATSLKPQRFAYYGIYDFIAMGSCFCNGHAEQCEPADGFRAVRGRFLTVVHGKCICEHNTVGKHCERCDPLYNDQPWRPADGKRGTANQCRKCKCNNHANSCHFDLSVWLASGNRSGGVCDNCKHNTEGQHCQQCQSGFYRNLNVPLSAPDTCLGKCECRNQILGNPKVFCNMKYTFVLKVKILSAHDKGSHAEVNVKVKKVLKLTKLKIHRGKRVLYPESWTNRGCTCPVLNPGTEYLVAGHEDVHSGRLIVNMKSFVQTWKPDLGRRMAHILRAKC
ncbi:netrin-4 isoform X3 [Carcharodon carcharias]|uniref:netrin-4 isoform X3 n=1 Tax=Carcharodon carcharias TaxID=13397 RepID=UPI001B7EB21C|nr:netrin-4 isoform X3 [Carcharodon carcharias]